MRSTKRTLFTGFAVLSFLILLTSPTANALDIFNRLSWKNPFGFRRQSEKPVEDDTPKESEAVVVKFGQLPTKDDDVSKTMTTALTSQSEESVFDRPVIVQTPTLVPVEELTEEDTQQGVTFDDGMPMEDTVVMPVIGFGMGIVPEAVKSSQVSEPFKMDLPLKSSSAEEMPVAQDSETSQAMPQLFSKEVISVPMLQAEQESMEEEVSSPTKKGDDVISKQSSWSASGILEEEESTQMETEQMAETEPQTGDMPITGRGFWGDMSTVSIQHVVEEQTKAEEPVVREEVAEGKPAKTEEEKAEETDLAFKALFDTTHIKEDLAKDTTSKQTEHESKGDEHRETEMAESVKGSGGSEEQTIVPFIPGKVIIPTGQKSLGSVQTPVDRPASPSIVLPVSSIVAKGEEESTTVPEEPTASTAISDVEKEEDTAVTEEPTVSTVISDVEEKEEKGATEADKPTESTAVAEEEDTVVPEEPTVSTAISDVQKEEDAVMTEEEDQAAISESLPGIGDEEEPVIETPSPSEDAIPSVSPIESPPTESTPDSSQEAPPPEPETTSKQEPVVDPEDVEAAEPSSPGQSLVHPEEEDQVQEEEEDQASGSSATGEDPVEWSTGATEEAPVAAKAAGPQAPTTFYPSAMGSRQQVSTMAALKEILGSAFANATNVKTDVETEEGRVAILIEEGGDLQLEGLAIGPMEGVDVLVKVAAGGELRLDDVSIRDRPQRRLRKALNGRASIKTGLLVDGGSVVSIRDSTFESATDTMIRVAGGSHLSCSGCVFSNNAGDRGGALLVRDSTLHLRSCRMTDNSANTGGAIHFDASGSAADFDASVLIEDTLFSRNEARGRGAGVYTSSARAIHIVDSRFQHGSASDGGAVYIQDVRIAQIDRSHFIDNKADGSGGGLVAKSTQTLSVLKSTFKNNEASGSFAGAGFISNCSDATFRSTNFVDNRAMEGGALAYIAPSGQADKIYLQNTLFEENNAEKRGGALLIQRDRDDDITEISQSLLALVNRTAFISNSAQRGGAVFVSSQDVEKSDVKISVSRSNFTQNKAHEKGGGVFCDSSTVVFSYAYFEHNEAAEAMNCAEHCGCQATLENPLSHLSDNVVRSRWIQDTCTRDDVHSITESENNGAHLMVYIYVTLSVVLVFLIMAIVIVVKKRTTFTERRTSRLTHRSLSSYVGPSRSQSAMSVPFQREDGDDDAERVQQPSLLPSRTFGEMDYYVKEGRARQAQTYDHAMYVEEQESASLAQTLSADHAFFEAEFRDDELETPLIPKLANIPEIDSHP